jgi:glucose/arabinose dehydrogenase
MHKAGLWVILCLLVAAPASAQLSSQLVVSGLSLPVAVVQDPTQPNVQFVVEQGGKIRVVRDGVLLPTDFLDITPLVLSGGERGLLGLAFAPDYATSRRFFVNYTRQTDGHTVISRYLRSPSDPVQAVPASRFDLRWPDGNTFIFQPFANHNGGDLQFGSDGFLYIPLGDGGASNDPAHRAQNPAELLGKMLRIDVSVGDADAEGYDVPPSNPFVGQPSVLPEIWAFGLRNPFRVTVDAISRGGVGAIVIGDVGQNAWEEIDYEPFGAGGRNYGWSIREGAHDNVTTRAPAFTPLVEPIAEYSRSLGNVIAGGVINRGTGLGLAYWGRYFFADFGAKRIWSIGLTINPISHEATASAMVEHTAALGGSDTIGNVSAFGIAANCDVLFLNYSAGQLRRIVNAGNSSGCPSSQDPFLGSGGGVFTNGNWFTKDHPSAAGAGVIDLPTGGCITDPPAAGWVCVGGGWVPPGHPLAGSSPPPSGPNPPAPSPPPPTNGGSSCTTAAPASSWVCVNGGWVPPGHPLATTTTPPTTTPPITPTPPTPPTGGTVTPNLCTSIQPASNWVCVNGGWLPPNHPLALSAPSNPTPPTTPPPTTPPPSSTSCTTPDPFLGIPGLMGVCVNGGWIPVGHPLAGGGG